MQNKWRLIQDLRGGTQSMRDAGNRWLPKWDGERDAAYKQRLASSFLFEAYDDTLSALAGKPFSKPITLENANNLDLRLTFLERNADRQGTSLRSFGHDVFDAGIDYGLTHVYVEFPATGGRQSRADESSGRIYPYFIHYTPPSVLGWETAHDPATGEERLMLVRLRDTATRPNPSNRWSEQTIETIRVVTAPGWSGPDDIVYPVGMIWTYQRAEGSDWVVDNPEGQPHSFPGVPLFTYYANRPIGFMEAYPVLEDLAWENVHHWQAGSDYDNTVSFASIPMIWLAGLTATEKSRPIRIRASQVFKFTSPEAKAGVLEGTGKGPEVAEKRLHAIEERMARLGSVPLQVRTGGMTATEKSIDTAKTDTEIHEWLGKLSEFLRTCYKAASQWIKSDIPDEFRVQVFSEFSLVLNTKDDLTHLREMRKAKDLSLRTYLMEIKRRGVLSDSIDLEDEQGEIEAEHDLAMEKAMTIQRGMMMNSPSDDEGSDSLDE